jgi:hypothetical protein
MSEQTYSFNGRIVRVVQKFPNGMVELEYPDGTKSYRPVAFRLLVPIIPKEESSLFREFILDDPT